MSRLAWWCVFGLVLGQAAGLLVILKRWGPEVLSPERLWQGVTPVLTSIVGCCVLLVLLTACDYWSRR